MIQSSFLVDLGPNALEFFRLVVRRRERWVRHEANATARGLLLERDESNSDCTIEITRGELEEQLDVVQCSLDRVERRLASTMGIMVLSQL